MKFEFSPHIAFQVKHYKKAKEFYEKIIGMEVVSSSEEETHFKKDGINFYAESSEKGNTFFEFRVDDIAGAKKLLEEEGCRITHVYSERSMMIADPYGMCFHIWQEADRHR